MWRWREVRFKARGWAREEAAVWWEVNLLVCRNQTVKIDDFNEILIDNAYLILDYSY